MSQSLMQLDNFLAKAKTDKNPMFTIMSDHTIINLLVWCCTEFPARYESFFIELELNGMTKADSKRIQGTIKKELKSRELKAIEAGINLTVKTYVLDAPVPDGYLLPIGVGKNESGQPVFPNIFITARLKNSITSKELIRLTWKRDGTWKNITCYRNDIARASDITKLAVYGLPVTSSNSNEIVDFLFSLEQENAHLIPKVYFTNKLGWTPDKSQFMWGQQPITSSFIADKAMELEDILEQMGDDKKIVFYPESDGEAQLAEGLFSKGEFETWVTAINELFQYPSVIVTLYASLLPPFLSILDCDNFTLDLACETSTGKTTTLKAATSCWGNPNFRDQSFVRTWYQTSNAMEGCVSMISDLPFIVDDTKQAEIAMKVKDAHDMISSVLYMISSGKGKGRAQVDGMRTTGTFNTVMLTSGELPSINMSKAGGAIARVLTLSGKPFGAVDQKTKKFVENIDTCVSNNFGHAGPRVVQFILQHKDDWDMWRSAYLEAREKIIELSDDSPIAGRVSKNIAALATVIPIIHAALPELKRDIHVKDLLGAVWSNVQGQIARADRPAEAARLVYEWACTNEKLFYHRHTDENGCILTQSNVLVGHWHRGNWDFIGFTRDCLKYLLRNEGFDFLQIINDWGNRNWLSSSPSMNNKQRKVNMGSSSKSVYALSRIGIDQALLQAGLEPTQG